MNRSTKLNTVEQLEQLVQLESNRRFKLKNNDEEFVYNPEKHTFSFYQFCRMHNPDRSNGSNKYKIHEMRKLIFDEQYNLIYKKEALIDSVKLQKFISNAPNNKYTLYETYEIGLIDMPSDLELHTANSHILNGSPYMDGFDEI